MSAASAFFIDRWGPPFDTAAPKRRRSQPEQPSIVTMRWSFEDRLFISVTFVNDRTRTIQYSRPSQWTEAQIAAALLDNGRRWVTKPYGLEGHMGFRKFVSIEGNTARLERKTLTVFAAPPADDPGHSPGN